MRVRILLLIIYSVCDGWSLAANYSTWMLDSVIARGGGIGTSGESTQYIALGVFQEALRNAITASPHEGKKKSWQAYLQRSLASSGAEGSVNVTMDVGEPLDRFSIGTSLIIQQMHEPNSLFLKAIKSLEKSERRQQRNANGGLWYYANPANLTFYANLSYLDGMYSYAPFTALLPYVLSHPGRLRALEQIDLQTAVLWNHTYDASSGLLQHGYDASLRHAWAAPVTGSSPIVWSRSLGWYTVGLVDSLVLALSDNRTIALECAAKGCLKKNRSFGAIRKRFSNLVGAEIVAVRNSSLFTNRTALWQVVTAPGEAGNFVESSGTALIAYAMAKGARFGLLDDCKSATETAKDMFADLLKNSVVRNANGSLSLNGTSSVASLSGEVVDYQYYTTRPVVVNSPLGTAAFVLAGTELGLIKD